MKQNVLCMFLILFAGICASSAQEVLRFNGSEGANWMEPNVWLNEAGNPVSWSNGSIAVFSNHLNRTAATHIVTLTNTVSVYKLCDHFSGTYYHSIDGSGQINLGAGGLEQNTGGELNSGIHVHITASQTWTALNPVNNSMICLSGTLTTDPGLTLTLAGSLRFRVHMNASSWTTNETVLFKESAQYWPSPTGRFGSARIILDGATATRDMLLITGGDMPIVGEPYFGSILIVSNAPALNLTDRTLALPLILSGGTGTTQFKPAGARLSLAPSETVLNLTAPLCLYNTLTNNGTTPSALRKTGPATLELAGEQRFTGGLTIEEGTLLASANGSVSNCAVSIAAGASLQLAMPNSMVVQPISGQGALIKSGTGTINLMTTNTYAGGTTLSGGNLGIQDLAALGSGPVTLASGTLRWLSNATLSVPNTTFSGSGTLCAGGATTLTWAGDYSASDTRRLAADAGGVVIIQNLTGSGFVKTDNGRLRLLGTSGYSGQILVATGVLEIASTDLLGSGVTLCTTNSGLVVLNTFRNQDLAKITGTKNFSYGGVVGELNVGTETIPTVISTETLTISSLTGSGVLTNNQPGTIVIAGTNNFSGSLVVNAGKVVIKTPLLASQIQVNAGGTMIVDAGGQLDNSPLSLTASSAMLIVTNSGSLGSGSLALATGVLRLNAGGSVGTRAITTSGGSIDVYDAAALDSATLTLSGGNLRFYRTGAIKIPVTQTANMNIESYTEAGYAKTAGTFAGPITVTSGKTNVRSSVDKQGQIVFAGGATYSGGELFVQSFAEWVIVSNRVTQPGYCGLESSGTRILVKDGGSLEMRGGSGTHLFIGVGSAGILEVGTNGTVNLGAAQCTVGYNSNGAGQVILNGGTLITTNTACNVRLGYNGTSVGTLALNSGTMQVVKPLLQAGASATITFNGGTLNMKANTTAGLIPSTVPITVQANGGTLNVETNNVKLGSAGISGPGTLRIIGGRVEMDVASPQWTGGVAVVSGEIAFATNTFYGSSLNVGSGTIRLAGTNAIASVSGTGGSLIVAGTNTIAALSGSLTKAGAGQMLIQSADPSVNLTVQEGTVAYIGVSIPQTVSPAAWIDAGSAASIVTNSTAGITRLYDRRTPGNTNGFYAEPLYNPPILTNRVLNTHPVIDFGTSTTSYGGGGDNRMLQFKQQLTNIRSVFWVIGSRNGGGFLLSDNVDASGRYFHRGRASVAETYGTQAIDPLWFTCARNAMIIAGETRLNGTTVNGTTTGLSGGWDQVSWRLSQADDTATNTSPISAIWFASCYANNLGRLNGGQDLAEVLIYTNRLNDTELAAVETYLRQKWFTQATLAQVTLATNACFINLSDQPVVIQNLTLQSAQAQVLGKEITIQNLTVQSQATFDPCMLAVQFGALTFEDNAHYAINADDLRLVTAQSVSLPATLRFSITGQTTLFHKQKILTAPTLLGDPTWKPIDKNAQSAKMSILSNHTELWVQIINGTLFTVR